MWCDLFFKFHHKHNIFPTMRRSAGWKIQSRVACDMSNVCSGLEHPLFRILGELAHCDYFSVITYSREARINTVEPLLQFEVLSLLLYTHFTSPEVTLLFQEITPKFGETTFLRFDHTFTVKESVTLLLIASLEKKREREIRFASPRRV